MSTKLTKTQQVYKLLSTGKNIKLATVAKKLYSSDDTTSQHNARRIINYLKDNYDIERVAEGTYKMYK